MSAAAGFLVMKGDSMLPTIKSGDAVGYYRSSRFVCDGLYVVDFGYGPVCMRVQDMFNKRSGGNLRLYFDNGAYTDITYTRLAFKTVCLGRVFAVCKMVDRTLMREAGVVFEDDAALPRERPSRPRHAIGAEVLA